jgi:hypothetical protein
LQNIERRILISIHYQPTVGTSVGALAEFLFDQQATLRAHLGCVAGVHQNDRPASLFRFADRHADKLAPRHIHDAFAHTAPASRSHLLRFKILKHDHLIPIHQLTAALVRKVPPSVGYSLVDVIECLLAMLVLIPLLSVFSRIFEFLRTFEVGFITPVETRILNLLSIRLGASSHAEGKHP